MKSHKVPFSQDGRTVVTLSPWQPKDGLTSCLLIESIEVVYSDVIYRSVALIQDSGLHLEPRTH